MSKKQFSAEEVAAIFEVSRQTIYNWTGSSGNLNASVVEELLEERQQEAEAAAARVERARRKYELLSGFDNGASGG